MGPEVVDALEGRLDDEEPAVRIAAALALHRLGVHGKSTPALIEETRNYNPLVGLYALRALEIADLDDALVRQTFVEAIENRRNEVTSPRCKPLQRPQSNSKRH